MSGTNRLRPATVADAGGIAAVYAPYVRGTSISFETDPPSADEMARRLTQVSARSFWIVCAGEGTISGYAAAFAAGAALLSRPTRTRT